MSTPAPLADVMITLGARDFPKLREFYRELGWPQIIDDKQFAAFEVRGVVLAVFPIAELARDGNTEPDPGSGGIRFTVGIMVDTPEEVDQLTEQMRAAGARLLNEPRQGAGGHLYVFVHPASTGGVLLELIQEGGH